MADVETRNLLQRAWSVINASQKMIREAEFVCESLPNVEEAAVNHTLLQLSSVDAALCSLSPATDGVEGSDLQAMRSYADGLRNRVIGHLTATRSQNRHTPPVIRNGTVGRPRYVIDLDRVDDLRWHGATWDEIARVIGLSNRRTLHNHMKRDMRPTARPYSIISDNDLDEEITDTIQQHPFSGAVIVSGLLASAGLRLPLLRIRESLRRVDPIGVLLRCVDYLHSYGV